MQTSERLWREERRPVSLLSGTPEAGSLTGQQTTGAYVWWCAAFSLKFQPKKIIQSDATCDTPNIQNGPA